MNRIVRIQLALWTSLTLSTTAWAADKAPIDPSSLCERLQIIEEVLVFDKSGTRIIDALRNDRQLGGSRSEDNEKENETVCRHDSASGYSSSSFAGSIFFRHEWTVKKDGTLAVTYEQGSEFTGSSPTRDVTLKDSTGKKTVAIKDFQAVSWVSPLHKEQRLVIRLTPMLGKTHRTRDVGKFPLYFSDATIFDGTGKLWTANLTAFGDFIGVLTLEGALVLSFQPFEQGTKAGKVLGKDIRFTLPDGKSVLLRSTESILPGDLTTDIYVMYDSELRAKKFGSQSVSSGSTATDTIERLKRHAER